MNVADLTLAQELAEMSRLVDDDVPFAVRRFVARLVRRVPGCDQAGIAVRTEDGVELVAMEGCHAAELAAVNWSTGPAAEALTFREPRQIADTLTDPRWPEMSRRLAGLGCCSCLVLPLPKTRAPDGVLVLGSGKPQRFANTVQDVVLLLALHAGVLFDKAQLYHDSRRLVEQLNQALHTRQTIGQAQGLLMHRFDCDSRQGFALLKGASQNTNAKLRDVASALVIAHQQGELTPALAKFGVDARPHQPLRRKGSD
ncbi:ANTAR domain-containing protein [Amycolatopsis thermoflava]|uniref:ANTAR domain-containing protein n=1 Tax=Amycolatopsis thermoflava TaxID=84480 RepID=UPI000409B0D0|nr:GAF and ANTAR domain-containing protein [Amycolatopsis thermoflava]